jgi:hypothetical protein
MGVLHFDEAIIIRFYQLTYEIESIFGLDSPEKIHW